MSTHTAVILTAVGYFLFSAAAGAMASPTPAQTRSFYGWLYRFAQRLAANADRLAEARLGLTADDLHHDPAGSAVVTTLTRERETISASAEDYEPGRPG